MEIFIHGLLHGFGYDHIRGRPKQMKAKEEYYIKKMEGTQQRMMEYYFDSGHIYSFAALSLFSDPRSPIFSFPHLPEEAGKQQTGKRERT